MVRAFGRESLKIWKRGRQALTLSPMRQLRWMIDRRVRGKLLLGKGARLQMGRCSILKVTSGSFYLNEKWASSDPFPSFLCLKDNAEFLVHDNFAVYTGSQIYVHEGAKLVFGGGYANHGLKIDCYTAITVGRNVAIAQNVSIRDSDNKSTTADLPTEHMPVKIGDNVWIGMNATILKGVNIGDGCIIAAGSVVVRSVPDNTLVAGVPARVIRKGVQWH